MQEYGYRNEGNIDQCEVRGELYTNDMDCAGICCENDGKITRCNVFAKLTNCVTSLKFEFGLFFQLPETGGIASFNSGLISNCNVESNLSNEYNGQFHGTVGGLISTNNGLIENSTFKGTVAGKCAGGIVGSNYTIIKSCSVQCTVKGTNAAEFANINIWGDEGYIILDEIKNKPQGVIDNCEFTGSVEASNKGLAVVDNSFTLYENAPQVKNCKINGVDVIREPELIEED